MTAFFSYIVPGVLSAVIIVLATYVIERCGPSIGGIMASSPHLVVINVIFIILDSPNESAIKDALFSIPMGIVGDGLFLLSWKYMPKLIIIRRAWIRLCLLTLSSYILWMLTPTAIFIIFHFSNNQSLIVYLGISCAALTFCIGMISALHSPPSPPSHNQTAEENQSENDSNGIEISGWKIYGARALAAFIAAVITNYLASIGLGILSGFMSVFPALFTVLMVSLWVVHGDDLPVQSAGPLLLGITSINMFALTTAWLYLYQKVFDDHIADLVFSVSVAWSISVFGGGLPMVFFMKYLERRGHSGTQNNDKLTSKGEGQRTAKGITEMTESS